MLKAVDDVRKETPPRMWGRPECGGNKFQLRRNTPTHVGKTQPVPVYLNRRKKHPHACGEDDMFLNKTIHK